MPSPHIAICNFFARAILIIALTTLSFIPVHAVDSTDRSVIGDWKIIAALDAADVASLDDGEARQLIGRTMTVRDKALRFEGQLCSSPDFESERVEPALYLREHYRASATLLGLPNPATIVHLDCTSAFIKNRNRLVIFWQGWFFDATRLKP